MKPQGNNFTKGGRVSAKRNILPQSVEGDKEGRKGRLITLALHTSSKRNQGAGEEVKRSNKKCRKGSTTPKR